jgi:hypothetical protein
MRDAVSIRPCDGQDGFSAAEALVATALTLVVVLAALGTFSQAVHLTDMARRTSETNQELQSALGLLVRDTMQAGQGIPLGGIPLPGGTGATAINRPAPAGTSMTFPSGTDVLPAVSPGGGLGPALNGISTDMFAVLMADPTLPISEWPLASVEADGASATMDARTQNVGPDAIRAGDLILFSSALGNALQMVTRTAGQVLFFEAGDAMNVNQRTAPQGTLLNLQSGPGTFPPMTATRVVLVSYYLDAITDPAMPRLVRQRNMGARLAIALGVDDLQVAFDLIDGATNPSDVEVLVAPQSPHQIRLVSLRLSGHAREGAAPDRAPYAHTVATRVSLRSLSFLDRYR